MRVTRFLSLALVVMLGAVPLACGGDDDSAATNTAVPSSSASAAATTAAASPSASATTPPATPTPRPPTHAEELAKSPAYFLYTAGQNDTINSVANHFNGQPGTAKAGFPGQIKDANELTSDTLAPGQVIAVPLLLGGTRDIIPTGGMELALQAGTGNGKLELLQPSVAMQDDFKGRLVLHKVQLNDNDPSTEGYGYTTEYWLADRAALKGGVVDPDARVMEPAFAVAGGTLAQDLVRTTKPADLYTFTRDGMDYAIRLYSGAQRKGADLAAMLATSEQH